MSKRNQLFIKQEGLCFYCNIFMHHTGFNLHKTKDTQQRCCGKFATLDHYIPKYLFPHNGFSRDQPLNNLVLACHSCNAKKGGKIPKGWDGKLGNWIMIKKQKWIHLSEIEIEIEDKHERYAG